MKPYASADCAEGTLKKHEGCFKQLRLCQLQCAWDKPYLKHLEVFRGYITPVEFPFTKNVPLKSFSSIVIGKQKTLKVAY